MTIFYLKLQLVVRLISPRLDRSKTTEGFQKHRKFTLQHRKFYAFNFIQTRTAQLGLQIVTKLADKDKRSTSYP
jgi:hypothetical protein